MRFLLLCASILFLAQPGSCQDKFSGTGTDTTYGGDSFSGAQNSDGCTFVSRDARSHETKPMSPEEFQKAVKLQNKLSEVLRFGSISSIAMVCYQLYNVTEEYGFKLLGDLASEEIDLDDIAAEDIEKHLDMLEQVLRAQGKSEQYIQQAIAHFKSATPEGANEVAADRAKDLDAKKDQLASSGLRKLNSAELKVFIEPVNGLHEIMVRHCAKRALDQILQATNNALQCHFVKRRDEANVRIIWDRRSYLWYEYQRHTSPVLTEPLSGTSISYVEISIPLSATLHRPVTEAECQEFCNREITRGLGYAWHPVSIERFTHDFQKEVADARKQKKNLSARLDDATRAQLDTISLVANVLYGPDRPGRLEYYAGLAYLSRGDYEMARRYFCNSTAFFIENSPALHSVINKFLGVGDISGAELVAFATINDDPDNDENSPATREYNRIKKFAKEAGRGDKLPVLSASDRSMLAKLYGSQPKVSLAE